MKNLLKILFLTLIGLNSFAQDVKISAMTAATDLTGTVFIPIIQGGVNKKAAASLFYSDIVTFNPQSGNYTLVIGDAPSTSLVQIQMTSASANNLTVPPNSSVAFSTGSQILVRQTGAGLTTFVQGAGVTITATSGLLVSPGQNYVSILTKTGTNTWTLDNGSPPITGFWASSGSTAITTPTLVGIPTFNGSVNITGSGAVPSLQITGVGTTTNYNFRLFQSDGTTEVLSMLDNGTFVSTPKVASGFTITGPTTTATANNQYLFGLTGSLTARATASDVLNGVSIVNTLTDAAATQTLNTFLINGTFAVANSATRNLFHIQNAGTDRFTMLFDGTTSLTTATSNVPFTISNNANAGSYMLMANPNAGTSAYAGASFSIGGNQNFYMYGTANNYTTASRQNALIFQNQVSSSKWIFAYVANNVYTFNYDGSTVFDGSITASANPTLKLVGAGTTTNYGLATYKNNGSSLNFGVQDNGNATLNGNLTLGTVTNKIFITEGSSGSVGQTTLVSGTKAITVTGTTTSSRCFATLVVQGGTVTTTVDYSCACTSNTVTITAVTNALGTNTSDTSTLNYWIVN